MCFEVDSVKNGPFVALTYSESPEFATVDGDATTDSLLTDIPLYFPLQNGTNCLGPEFIRGGFKYLSIRLPADPNEDVGFWHTGSQRPVRSKTGWPRALWSKTQHRLGFDSEAVNDSTAGMVLADIWVNCTAFPSNPNPRAYTGYFSSSSTLLNRIWYAGAYTLQLSTLDPKEGSALIDYNRVIDHNQSPKGSWYSNFSIANGSAVTTDGAKRDRMVWPGDMSIAVPGIAVSTYDMIAVRNALDTLFAHQYWDGSLPYAGPPMGFRGEFSDTYHLHTLLGVYNYVLYSGDLNWLKTAWPAYLVALQVSINKVDETGLLHVSSTADWLRPGMTGHNLEASAILYDVLHKSVELSGFIGSDLPDAQPGGLWLNTTARIRAGIERMHCNSTGLFADNIGRRNCGGPEEVLPQDGNSWTLLTRLLLPDDPRALNVSENLRRRWNKFGAPAVEFPNVISPFASSFELLAHCAAGNHDAAVELMELMWGYMLDGPGMTNSTLVEGYRTDGYAQYPAYWSPARGSHAHGWSTGPTMTLLTEILGIKLLAPLGRRWEIRPHLTKWLSHAQGGYSTSLGKFEVKLKIMKGSGGRQAEVLEVTTPEDSEGVIWWGGQEMNVVGGRWKIARYLDAQIEEERVLLRPDSAGQVAAMHDRHEREQGGWQKASEGDGEFVVDEEWRKPAHEKREPGVVDWEALQKNFIVAPPAGVKVPLPGFTGLKTAEDPRI